jgi:ABC-type dipeptide/oligopeptide/nickel transport system permease component
MLRFALRRLLLIIPTVWVVLTVVFVLVRVAPGDPAMAILGQNATQESLESLREQMGLKDPLWLQYVLFLGNLVRGDLGVSMLNSIPVKNQLLTALPYTLELTLSSMVVGVILGLPLGVVTALRRNRWADYVGRVVSLTGISIPSFYLGILLIFIFSVKLGLFPVMGTSRSGGLFGRIHHLILPAFSMGLILTSYIMRVGRSTMLNILNEDYIRTAKAKGLRGGIVVYKHALPNALIPIILFQ